ncbi:MAG: phosphoserine phosphatase SerB [Bdellovibrionota bacterium]
MKRMKSSFLITVSGKDRPGITAAITGVLAKSGAEIIDVAQAVIHELLSLSILCELSNDETALKELVLKTNELGMKLEFKKADHESSKKTPGIPKAHHYAVTLIADRITAAALHDVSSTLASHDMNIDVIKRLSEGAFSSVEMLVSSADEINKSKLKKELLSLAARHLIDIALQSEGLYRRAKRLVVMDMDSTLIQSEVIDELAKEKGTFKEVSDITQRAMAGEINYDESLRQRCAKIAGLTTADLEKVFDRITLTPGAKDLIRVLKKLGYKIAVISGGFTFVADRLKERLHLDYAFANELELESNIVTGKVIPPIVNSARKADLLDVIAQQEHILLDQVIAIGDGANDLLMLEKAGLGIAFNAKPTVREKADLAISQKNMRSILYLLGLSEKDLSEALR